jgi:hypothetical protein
MPLPINEDIAGRLDEVANILAEQGASRFRVHAYQHAAAVVRGWPRPVSEIFKQEGLAGLEKLPGVGESIARAICDLLRHGRLAMLERLRGEHDPIALLSSVPGIGKVIAWQLHDELGLESLEDLEGAAHDGRLANFAGLGSKRLAGIRDSLAQRLGRIRPDSGRFPTPLAEAEPPVDELLDVDDEYRREAAAGHLTRIAPRRFNPSGESWLPVLHTTRGQRHYTALYSNTARAHDLHKTRDWVVLHYEGRNGEQRYTVITAEFGPLAGRRMVRGREAECVLHDRMIGPGFHHGVNPTATAVESD